MTPERAVELLMAALNNFPLRGVVDNSVKNALSKVLKAYLTMIDCPGHEFVMYEGAREGVCLHCGIVPQSHSEVTMLRHELIELKQAMCELAPNSRMMLFTSDSPIDVYVEDGDVFSKARLTTGTSHIVNVKDIVKSDV